MLRAVVAWAASLRWIPVAGDNPNGPKHQGTSWAELLLDFQITTGLDTPAFHRPRAAAAEGEELAEPDNLAVKARAFSRFVTAAERVVGSPLLAPS